MSGQKVMFIFLTCNKEGSSRMKYRQMQIVKEKGGKTDHAESKNFSSLERHGENP